ncbi:MAG: DUF4301 family protein [Bacteroidaceae bacterium]|mgnify:FL=1|nr:DUF4301 family protein [Bacteroidaceae bacterium]
MFTQQDLAQLDARGIAVAQAEKQLEDFKRGFPFLRLKGAAAIGAGIQAPDEAEQEAAIAAWNAYKAEDHRITKFVPASGAASRMFKALFEYQDSDHKEPQTAFEKEFVANIHKFAFFADLDAACVKNNGKGIDALIAEGDGRAVVANLLGANGLNYGALPKGLLKFHSYEDGGRTPVEEHLVEAALYASSDGKADVHFTVSTEHKALFGALVDAVKGKYEAENGIRYDVSFSEQKPSTDTMAANMDNTPFRNSDGSLLFRPGGHGALIQNLNDLDSEVVFVKNIDNVVPDNLKPCTTRWKQVIAGILVKAQAKAFAYLKKLESGDYAAADLQEMVRFVQQELCCRRDDLKNLEDAELVIYLKAKLNRPMRVCGVVKNVGEPGGGPFVAYNPDGTTSPQILESSQIDTNNPEYMAMFTGGTHFNPVDLVCAIKDYKGGKFDLPKYVDPATGFISYKSKSGKDLKALELPGLWNGAMSDWSTIMVEVPIETFNPVKTVNDLLREQHQ